MISVRHASTRTFNGCLPNAALLLRRKASLTSSISRGVRKAADALKNAEKQRIKQGTLYPWEGGKYENKGWQTPEHIRKQRLEADEQKSRLEWLSTEEKPQVDEVEIMARSKRREKARRAGILFDAPAAIPYTHATSEFIYGTFPILCALKAKRRDLRKLYVWCGEDGDMPETGDENVTRIVRMAHFDHVEIVRVAGSWGPMLDRMRALSWHGKMHRSAKVGLMLEAGPLPQPVVRGLQFQATARSDFRVPIAMRDGKEEFQWISNFKSRNRYPFLVWLDRITDVGNMGAILRSACYFGVDAVVVPGHGTASLNGATITASAGAGEFIPVLSTYNELQFVEESKKNGWKFYATAVQGESRQIMGLQNNHLDTALSEHPCVLMMGNEALGLRPFLAKAADHVISVEGAKHVANDSVDSLNVSVAAALMIQRFVGNHVSATIR